MNLTYDIRRAPKASGITQAGDSRFFSDEQANRELMCALIRQTLTDYAHMVRNGFVSPDSWLALSEKGKAFGMKLGPDGVMYPAGSYKGSALITPEDMRMCLRFLGDRQIDHVCEWIGTIHVDEVRRAAMKMHAAWRATM